MIGLTLGKYLARRFIAAVATVFIGMFVLVLMIDYIEQVRRTSVIANVEALDVVKLTLFRVPQFMERLVPICVLVGAMSCFLELSRRLELVVVRAAGVSAWQFVTPIVVSALILGVLATTIYNPISTVLQDRSRQIESEIFGQQFRGTATAAFWINQATADGQAIVNAASSGGQGTELSGVTVFRFNPDGSFKERIEAQRAVLEPGRWRLSGTRRYTLDDAPQSSETTFLSTNLTSSQVREGFATPETVSFWQLSEYIASTSASGPAAAGYKLRYQKLISQPFLLVAMVLLASAMSLRFFRFGGVQKMVLSGIGAGFLLYVLSKVTDDLSKADLMNPVVAAWLPVLVGSLSGFMALLYQEDG